MSLAVCFYLVVDLADLNPMAWPHRLWVILMTPRRDNLANINRMISLNSFESEWGSVDS